ncbi:MAG TPA: hypothetical protein VGS22_23305 [Thermoanaerobaculia bacterium]|jgi:hypothetical protein|nr:hypothetical protein [Thermoanaerobaculia bacterium]
MRSLFLRSIVLLLGLTPFAFAFAEEPPEALPLAREGVALLAQLQDQGWVVHFLLAKVLDGASIRYRRLGAEEWHSIPEVTETVGPLDVGTIGTGEQVFEVEVIDSDGEGTGRFRLSFDPQKERIRQAHYFLDHVGTNDWVSFYGTTEDTLSAYFNTVWDYRDVLRSIRYSLDGCQLDRTPEAAYGPIPPRFTYLCMQLVYMDGEVSPPRIFFKKNPGVTRRRPVRPVPPKGPLSMTPPEPGAGSTLPVKLESSRSNSGWSLLFEVEEGKSVAEFRYRLETDTAWHSTGDLPWINPRLGRRLPNPEFTPDPLRVTLGRQKIEVQLVGTDGTVSGPYTLWFDPDEEILVAAKADLGDPERKWGMFEEANDRSPFYFAVFDDRDSLREIRYSVDDCSVGKKFEFPPWNDITKSPPIPDNAILWVPKETAYVCLQLVFTDGEVSEVRRFENVVVEEEIQAVGEDPQI